MFSKSTRCNCSKNNGPDYGWENEAGADRGITMTCNLIQISFNMSTGRETGRWLILWHMAWFIFHFSTSIPITMGNQERKSLIWGAFRLHPDAIFCLSLLSTATRRPQFGYGAYDWHWLEPGKTNCAVWSGFLSIPRSLLMLCCTCGN